VDAKCFKLGVMLVVVSRSTDVRFSCVGHFHWVDLFSFIGEKVCSQMQVLPNKSAQTVTFCCKFGYLSLTYKS
jgi:hypothetical protein